MGRETSGTWQSMPTPRASKLSSRLHCTPFSPRCLARLSSAARMSWTCVGPRIATPRARLSGH
eukprot:3069605-Pyramimonas_sp.AAC.1